MANTITFDSVVAARTRAADHILKTPAALSAYEAKGGLPEDLQAISAAGHEAESLSQAQSAAQAAGGAATLAVLASFKALQQEYGAVMSVVQAARLDLVQAGADAALVAAVEKILVNEAETYFRTIDDGKGSTKKKAAKRETQEALRAEIARDARALLDLAPVHVFLGKRKVDPGRLAALLDAAAALSGKLADRAAAKGGKKTATAAVHDAVSKQKQAWAAVYRLLAAVGAEDPAVQQLLKEAVGKEQRKPQPKK